AEARADVAAGAAPRARAAEAEVPGVRALGRRRQVLPGERRADDRQQLRRRAGADALAVWALGDGRAHRSLQPPHLGLLEGGDVKAETVARLGDELHGALRSRRV